LSWIVRRSMRRDLGGPVSGHGSGFRSRGRTSWVNCWVESRVMCWVGSWLTSRRDGGIDSRCRSWTFGRKLSRRVSWCKRRLVSRRRERCGVLSGRISRQLRRDSRRQRSRVMGRRRSGNGRGSERRGEGRRECRRLSWLERFARGGEHRDELLGSRVRGLEQARRDIFAKDVHASRRALANVAIRNLSDEIAAKLPELGWTKVVRDTAHSRGSARESDEC
jgi:hypothetical protein